MSGLEISVSLEGPSATAAEAAAISAAVQHFQSDTALAPPPEGSSVNPWSRAALLEGVSAKDDFGPRDTRELF